MKYIYYIFFFYMHIWSARGENTHVRSRARARRINDLRKWYRLGWGYARVVCGSAGWVWRGEGVQVARGWRASCVIGCLMSQGRTWRDPLARIFAFTLGVVCFDTSSRCAANFSHVLGKFGDPIRPKNRGTRARDASRGCILKHFWKKKYICICILIWGQIRRMLRMLKWQSWINYTLILIIIVHYTLLLYIYLIIISFHRNIDG